MHIAVVSRDLARNWKLPILWEKLPVLKFLAKSLLTTAMLGVLLETYLLFFLFFLSFV